jgi:hypothetical protein
MLRTTDSLTILVLYVDDILITDCSTSSIAVVKGILHDRFLMMDMGPLHYFLGLEISQDASGIKLSQTKYARDLMERFHMTNCKFSPTPFLSGVRLEDGGALHWLTKLCTYNSWGVCCISPTPNQTYHMQWEQFPRTCMSHMRSSI